MQKRNTNNGRTVSPGRGAAGPAAGTSGRARKPSDSSGGSSSSSSSGGKYRYCVLSGNESVLLKEALQRRPWWEPAPENSDRWNLWAGLNGQRFDQYDLLSPLPAASTRAPLPITASTLTASKASTAPTAIAATAAPAARSASGAAASSSGRGAGGGAAAAAAADPRQRRCVNRLPEHRVLCTKSGLAGVLATLVQAQGQGQGQGQGLGSAAGRSVSAGAASAEGGGGGSGTAGSGSLSWIPETYVVAAGPKAPAASPALSRFKSAFAKHAAAGRRVWIAKPTSLNRGNGIEVFDSLDRILDHIKTRPAGSNLILQKYIENPLLLGGRKFDIRAYVLVGPPQLAAAAPADAGGGGDGGRASGAAAAAPYAEAAPVWFHREAYVRTSSTPYDPANLGNRSAHLTNDAVQKTLDTYHAFEDHCKLSLAQLGPELIRQAGQGPPAAAAAPAAPAASTSSAAAAPAPAPAASTPSAAPAPAPAPAASTPSAAPARAPAPAPVQPVPVPSVPVPVLDTAPGSEAGLWGRMRHCVAALLGASAHLLNPLRLGGCWELLGLDFMLDDAGGLYLIEVNTSPALFRAGAYLSDLLPRLVEEVVQRAVDPLFPPLPPPPAAAGAAEAAAETAAKAAEAAAVAGPAAGAGEVAAGERDAAAGGSSGGIGDGGRGGRGSSTITPLDGFVRVELLPPPAPGTARAAGANKGNGAVKSGATTAAAKGAGGDAVGGTAAAGRQLAQSSSGAARGSAAGGGSSNGRAAQNGSSKAVPGRMSPGRVYAAGTAGAGASAKRK
ncbi:hypothetical protein CHLRE_04g212550v5 [Chlamydomonas reinhardtii]|uniref:Uncharacterized protein n=1 Tax=Chlamydomonas reinhardtii TaxID=3055 RepID=A0A2K3DTY8_CHLRE|nr:uncharacterized protein CHLRE_04g212550v5 [Chlamydomonas reinhardtii]PNW83994.1 hypothetical protein CHLRE_04g212550v5 [Chlamydomonas reinhardtii]